MDLKSSDVISSFGNIETLRDWLELNTRINTRLLICNGIERIDDKTRKICSPWMILIKKRTFLHVTVITVMKIAIEGCAHGELEKIYDTIELIEKNENIHVDLLICCGDFQSTRNLEDLRCMAVPPKYYNICTFYKYYSGEKVAPYLTIFIGGNHEASNYLQELAFGGWVAPNIYYLGYAGVVNVGGIRIGGISGIYKSNDYFKGRYEYSPYSESTKRSIYHIRNLDIFRLKQITQPIDIFLSHDWPRGVHKYGDEKELLRNKPFFQSDIEENRLGSEPATELLHHLKPKYWFSAHLHTKFPAIIQHNDVAGVDTKVTKFLALDKCLPKRKFLQVIDIANDNELSFKYDLEWLTILYLTNHLTTVKCNAQYMPGPGSEGRWVFTPTKHEMNSVLEKFQNDLTIPNNFIKTARAYDPTEKEQTNLTQPPGQTNPQTTLFCEKLGIDDPTYLILKQKSHTNPSFNACRSRDSFNFIPASVEKRLNISLPEKKIQEYEMPKPIKLNLTLPAPKKVQSDVITESAHTDIIDSFNDTELNTSELNSTTIFSEDGINTSTPQKKFKRRNESIYKTLD